MNDNSVRPAPVAAVVDELRAAGFAEAPLQPSTAGVVLATASAGVAVLVRIMPQHTGRHAFVTLICATCRRHRVCGWRALLGADVPALVVATCAQTALCAPMSCESGLSAASHTGGEQHPAHTTRSSSAS